MLSDVLRSNLELFRVWLLFAHAVLKAGLAIRTHGRNKEQVSLSGSQDPVSVSAHFNRTDGIA